VISGSDYISIHRTYPGIEKPLADDGSSYVPPARSWFKKAPEDGLFIKAYMETFTSEVVINLSSRKTMQVQVSPTSNNEHRIAIVATTVMRMNKITELVQNTHTAHSGSAQSSFTALMHKESGQVWVWGADGASTYMEADGTGVGGGSFKQLSDLQPNFGSYSYQEEGVTEVTSADGDIWYIAAVEMFGDPDDKELVALVFSKRAEALSSLEDMENLIDGTVLVVDCVAIAGCTFTAVVTVWLVILLANHISAPLVMIRKCSEMVLAENVKKPKNRNYSRISGHITVMETKDELQDLCEKFEGVVAKLHTAQTERNNRPKYPINPFRGDATTMPYHQQAMLRVSTAHAALTGEAHVDEKANAVPITITTKELTGNTKTLTVTDAHTVNELKAACGASLKEVTLLFQGEPMAEPGRSLKSYGVVNGSELSIVPGNAKASIPEGTPPDDAVDEKDPLDPSAATDPSAAPLGQTFFNRQVTCCGSLRSKLLRPVGGLLLSMLLAVPSPGNKCVKKWTQNQG